MPSRPPTGQPTSTPRPAPPGQLTVAKERGLARDWQQARAARRWEPVADTLARHRAAGVPVAVLAAAAGVSVQSVRSVCHAYGPDPTSLGDPVTDSGWLRTPDAAHQLRVAVKRLEEHAAAAEQAGISVIVGWYRRWHAPSLPAWWAATAPPTPAATARDAGAARAARVRDAIAVGATWQQVAATEGVSIHTVWRDLRG